jgi:hypothetical protein
MPPLRRGQHHLGMAIDPIEAELITAIDELLAAEPTDEEGLCPWCGAIRAPWATFVMTTRRIARGRGSARHSFVGPPTPNEPALAHARVFPRKSERGGSAHC